MQHVNMRSAEMPVKRSARFERFIDIDIHRVYGAINVSVANAYVLAIYNRLVVLDLKSNAFS